MPKYKSKRALRKGVRLTGSGRLKRNRANKSHILTKKTSKRKRNLRRPTMVATNGEVKRIKRLILA